MQLTEEVVAPNPGSNAVIEILFADWFSDSVGLKVRVCTHVIVSRTSSLLVNIEWGRPSSVDFAEQQATLLKMHS